jgi:hypothetical protein
MWTERLKTPGLKWLKSAESDARAGNEETRVKRRVIRKEGRMERRKIFRKIGLGF